MSNDSYNGPKHPAADCKGCSLYGEKYIANKITGTSVAFIGEAPTYADVKTGQPFSGPAGTILHRAAENVGITNPNLLNLVGCKVGKGGPSANAIHRCSGRLEADLIDAGVETAVVFGSTASKIFTGQQKVTQSRIGPPKNVAYRGMGLKVIPTFNPAYCLRNGDGYPSFKSDLKKVNAPPSEWEAPDWRLIDEPVEAEIFIRDLWEMAPQPMVIDIEVGIEKDSDFGHSERYQMLCIGIVIAGQVTVLGENACTSGIIDMFESALVHHAPICHNGKFDLTVWPNVNLYFDTMLASYVMDERPGTNSLEYNAVEILGSPSWKQEVESYLGENKNYADIPRDVLYKYNAYDIWNTWLLYLHFDQEMSVTERDLHDLLCRLSSVLMHAEIKGSRMDLEYLEKLNTEMLAKLEELEEPTKRWVDNPRSPLQVKAAFAEMGYRLSDTQELTLEVLRRSCKREAELFIDAILKYRETQKLHSTYVKGLIKRVHEGRIHTSFLIHGTTTGRLSSRNPNIQNQPRGPLIRSAYIPDDGFVYIQADYKTAELRVIGIESGDTWLRSVLADPARDIHGEVADQFYGPGAWDKDQRVRAKAVVFGVSYDRQADSIAREYDISVKEAQGAIDAFFGLMPDAVAWRDELVDRVMHGWDPTNHFGRQRRFHLITPDNRDEVRRQTLAFIPQSTANDICFRAAVRLWEEHRLDIRILVHDSILVQARPDEAKEIGPLMAKVMQDTAAEVYSTDIPFFVDIEIGTSWGALA